MSVITSMDIFDLKPERDYIFRVTPRNRFGWGEGACSRTVRVGCARRAPRFCRPLPAITKCLLGDSLSLECEVEGDPSPDCGWLRDGIAVPTSLHRLRVWHCAGRCRLSIGSVRPSDQGTYTCHAASPVGEASTFTRLTVLDRELLLSADRAITSALHSDPDGDGVPTGALAPFFLLRPRERRVEAGSSVRLSCQVTGQPRPQVTWARHGHTLQQEERFSMWHEAHDFYTLEITSTKFADVGTYSATATNEHGAVSCSCTLVVDCGPLMYVGPELVRPLPEEVRVETGAILQLQARCTAYPAISVQWHRDGRRVRLWRGQTLQLAADGLTTLRLPDARRGHAGVYSCTLANEAGSVVTSTRLVVQDSAEGPVEAPCFARGPASSHVLEGDPLTVTCEVVGDPAPEVTWCRHEAPPDTALQLHLLEDNIYCVRLAAVAAADAGRYAVSAANCHGAVQTTMSLEVTAKDTTTRGLKKTLNGTTAAARPAFSVGLQDVRCCDSNAATFCCRLGNTGDGDSAAIQWFRDGVALTSCDQWQQRRSGSQLQLHIVSVHPEDQGQYTCLATTDAGRAATRACLIVDVPEDSDLHVTGMLSSADGPPPVAAVPRAHLSNRATPARLLSPRLSVPRSRAASEQPGSYLLTSGGCARLRRRLEAPRFYAAPHDRTAEEGDDVTLKCSVSGQPAPEASWDRENITLRSSDKYRVTEVGDDRMLLIRGVKKCDAGLYRVTLHSDAGRMQATARLCVIGKPRPLGDHGVTSGNRGGTERGSRLARSRADGHGRPTGCGGAPGPPAGGLWFCDAEMVPGSRPLRLGGGGSAVARTPPKFVHPLRDVTAAEGDRVRLEVTVSGAEPVQVTWVKDGRPMPDCADFRHEAVAGGHRALVIADVYPADQGLFFCEAASTLGRAVCHCRLTVLEEGVAAKLCTKGSAADGQVSAPAGAAVRLWVRAVGVSSAEWFLAGRPVERRHRGRVQVRRTADTLTLEVLRLLPADAGTVSVTVRGPAGGWRAQVALRVTSAEQATSPAKQATSAAQQAASPVNGAASVAEKTKQTTSTEQQAIFPVQRATSLVRQTPSAAEQVAFPVEQTASAVEQTTSPVRQTTDPAEETTSFDVKQTDVIKQTAASTEREAQPSEEAAFGEIQTVAPAGKPTPLAVKQATEKLVLLPEQTAQTEQALKRPDVFERQPTKADQQAEMTAECALAPSTVPAPVSDQKTTPSPPATTSDQKTTSSPPAPTLDQKTTPSPPAPTSDRKTTPSPPEPTSDQKTTQPHPAPTSDQKATPSPQSPSQSSAAVNNDSRWCRVDSEAVELHITGSADIRRRRPAAEATSCPAERRSDSGASDGGASDGSASASGASDGGGRLTIVQGPASLSVLLGQTARLECRLSCDEAGLSPDGAQLAPDAVIWSKAGRRLEPSDRVTLESTAGRSQLTLRHVTADDSGKYVVRAGGEQCWASLAVEGPPEPPSGVPNITSISPDSFTLSWCGPPFDGGSMVTEYQVETRSSGGGGDNDDDDEGDWRLLVDHCRSTSVVVAALPLPAAPLFRVKAVNKHGPSAPGVEARAPPPWQPAEPPTARETAELAAEQTSVAAPFAHREVTLAAGVDFLALYDVREELGKGRFGTVHKVIEKSTGHKFAAKFIKCIKSTDRAKVEEEIAIMNVLDHTKLLQLAAALDHGREMIMLLEYVSGGELFERVVADDFTLTERQCMLFMQQICSGIQHMHALSIMHLDMKPENILCITKSSHLIKIIDFGLARRYRESEPTRVMLGTPEFIPPEIINYEPISPRSDMWSLGVICYILLSGLSPFMGDSDAETFANITRAAYDFEDDAFDAVTETAKEFITQLLQSRQAERMSANAALLHSWITSGQDTASDTVLCKEKLKKFIIRRKWQKRFRWPATARAVAAEERWRRRQRG